MFRQYKLSVDTLGANGAATGAATTEIPIDGAIWEIYVDYHASAPNTTVLTITESDGPARTLFTAPAGNTDRTFRPRPTEDDASGAARTTDTLQSVAGRKLTATVTLSNALTAAAVVWITILED